MQQTFNDGANVRITATPHPNNHFLGWTGDLAGDTNPVDIVMDSDKNITAVGEPDVPIPIIRTLTLNTSGNIDVIAEEIIQPPPSPPPSGVHYGKIWTAAEAEIIVDDIFGFDWAGVARGTVVLITGTYNSTWRPDNISGLTILMKDLVFNAGGSYGWRTNDLTNVSFHSVDGDFNNARFNNIDGKNIDFHGGGGMLLDGFSITTPTIASQTDGFYFQDMKNTSENPYSFKVVNSSVIINNTNDSAHNDFIQGFRCEGNMVVWNVFGRQVNNKIHNAQGFFNELEGSNIGTIEVQYCDFEVGRGGIVAVRNKDNTRRGHCIIKNNRVRAKDGHEIWLNYPESHDVSNNDVGSGEIRID